MSRISNKINNVVLIVSYNGRDHLEKLLPSLFDQTISKDLYRVVVVDNGSSDTTEVFLGKKYPEIIFIPLSKNKGFAEANNIGIKYSATNFEGLENIIFLNNDTMVSSNFLEILTDGINRHTDAASVQTKIVSMDSKTIDSVGISLHRSFNAVNTGQGELDTGQHDNSEREIFGTTGSAMIAKIEALRSCDLGDNNYFDRLYFAYNEDVDLALRFRSSGYSSWYVPGATVRHVHSATGGNQSKFKAFHSHRNTIFNIIKNAPGFSVFTTLAAFVGSYFSQIKNNKEIKTSLSKLKGNIGSLGIIMLVLRVWISVIIYIPVILLKRYFLQRGTKIGFKDIKRWLYI